MKHFLFIVIYLAVIIPGYCQSATDDVLNNLDEIIDSREYFIEKKRGEISELKRMLRSGKDELSREELFDYYLELTEQYETFKFDSAYHYAAKLEEISQQINDPDKLAVAQIKLANVLISAGLFNEMLDTLQSVVIQDVSSGTRAYYYSVLSRGYFDMESFSQSLHYDTLYHNKGMALIDSAMKYYPKNSWQYLSLKAQKDIKTGNNDEAIETLENLIYNYDLSNDQVAIQLMSLAFTYGILGMDDKALRHMVEASIADFRAAKKETVALLFVANYLFERGEVERASRYINIALEDSRFYGSNFRIWQVSQFLPFIKAEHIVTIERQKQQLWYYAAAVSVLSLVVLVFLFVIVRQVITLRKSKRLVERINNQLTHINEELVVANKIKEKYVGYFFSVNSQLIEKLDKYKNTIKRKVTRRQFDDLLIELESVNISHEKQNLYKSFDQAFLKIFPDFVTKFNKLLKEDEQIVLKEGQLLNTELRIFSLIRLGIHDNEKISKILGYSVNTIYAYKSKIKNKSVVRSEDFEDEVMKIKHF